MVRNVLAAVTFVIISMGLGCAPEQDENSTDVLPPDLEVAATQGEWIDALPPQEPGPPPADVGKVVQPSTKWIKKSQDEIQTMADMRQLAMQVTVDNRSPISNGNFERWEKTGPSNWQGNFRYENVEPSERDVTRVDSDLDGYSALLAVNHGRPLTLWQEVSLPMPDATYTVAITAYVQAPVPDSVAIRLVNKINDDYVGTEVYPVETDGTWVRYYAEATLKTAPNVEPARLYITRDSAAKEDAIIDGVNAKILRLTPAAKPESPGESSD